MLLLAEPRNLTEITAAYSQQRLDLQLVEAADHLRGIAGRADTLARISARRFAITVFESDFETLEEAWVRIRAAARERHLEVGISIFDRTRPLSLSAMLAQAEQDLAPSPKPAAEDAPRVAGAA
jgi:GGDEF domain-containing protein